MRERKRERERERERESESFKTPIVAYVLTDVLFFAKLSYKNKNLHTFN